MQEYVRLILEAAQDVTDKALGVYPGEGGQMIVIWDPAIAASAIEKDEGDAKEKLQRSSPRWILGIMTLESPKSDHWKGWEVKASAAQKGFGPGMYDVAMSLFGIIYSDRESVSQSAQGVWRYYKDRRDDVKRMKFDDKTDPKTPQKVDDGDIRADDPEDPTNFAYKGVRMPTGSMRTLHTKSLVSLARTSGLSIGEMNNLVIEAAEEFFAAKYGT